MLMQAKVCAVVLVALLTVSLLTSLGIWQLRRAEMKEHRWQQWQNLKQNDRSKNLLPSKLSDETFVRAQVQGRWIAQRYFLWQRWYQHRYGAHVVMPFEVQGSSKLLMVDRGWQPHLVMPHPTNDSPKVLTGIVYRPQRAWQIPGLGRSDKKISSWPETIQFLDLAWLKNHLEVSIYPYILVLDADHTDALQYNWQPNMMPASRHRAYAFQWFALAVAMAIAWGIVIRRLVRR